MEFKYRGERIDNGELVYGSLYHYTPTVGNFEIFMIICGAEHTPETGIIFGKRHEVEKESVSIFFGKKDKNGKEIYTNDKVKYKGKDYQIKYFEEHGAFGLMDISSGLMYGRGTLLTDNLTKQMEII